MNYVAILYAVAILGALGIVFGIILGVAAKKFEVKTDERVARVRECLGGANCGACGFAGCDAFAEAVVKGEAKPNGCTPGGAKAAKAIGEIMGVAVSGNERPKVARVRCNGVCGNVEPRYEYTGVKSCRAAASLAGGPKVCQFSCLGYGDCLSRCKFGAISLEDGIAHVDPMKCTGCGMCEDTCPRNIIHLLPRDKTVVVTCRNKAVGKIARTQCKTACIGCKMCERTCPSEAIHVEDGVAIIDDTKCTRCGACVAKCPMHCIHNFYEEQKGWEEA